jgi:hypothetical protein
VLGLSLAALTVGCASSSTTRITESHVTSPTRFDRLAVFYGIPMRDTSGFRGEADSIFHGFKTTLPDLLAACGVAAQITRALPNSEGDKAAPVEPSLASGVQLIIKFRSGEINTVTTTDRRGRVISDKEFQDLGAKLRLVLFDHDQQRVVWSAFADLRSETRSGYEAGQQLARIIGARLRSDGILTRCAPRG